MSMILEVSSPDLVVAIDRYSKDGVQSNGDFSREEGVLLNILDANNFDAIPLVPSRGKRPMRIARRRYHDGDPSDIFILDTDEVSVFNADSTVLEALISVVSNEHHIALVEDEGRIKSIITLETLADTGSTHPYLEQYLDRKVSDVAIEAELDLDASLGRRIFASLRELATLIDDDRRLLSDHDFTKKVIDTLVLLQPLKNHLSTNVDLCRRNSARGAVLEEDLETAGGIMRQNMVGIMESEDHRTFERARDDLSEANDFSSMLVFDRKRAPAGILVRSGAGWARQELKSSSYGQSIGNVLRQLSKLSRGDEAHPVVVVRSRDGSHGIITREEASSKQPVSWLLRSLVRTENACKDWLAAMGVDRVPVGAEGEARTVELRRASFGQVLRSDQAFTNAIGGRHKISELTAFRNELVHEVIDNRIDMNLEILGSVLKSIDRLMGLLVPGDIDEVGPPE